jgi:hypothetical protein
LHKYPNFAHLTPDGLCYIFGEENCDPLGKGGKQWQKVHTSWA